MSGAPLSMTLRGFAHDLRNALTIVRVAAAEIIELADRAATLATLRHLASDLETGLQRALRYVARIERGMLSFDPVDVVVADPESVLRLHLAVLQFQAKSKGIRLDVHPPQTAVELRFDPILLGRIVDNLVGNAIRFAPAGSVVRVVQEAHADEWELCVVDQGPGIPPHESDLVSRAGYVGSAPAHDGEPRSGLGIWIADQAARALGGRIVLRHAPEGTCASLALPLDQPAHRP